MNRIFDSKGHSLIELIIVLSIIAILAFFAIPQFIKFINRGYKSEIDQNARDAFTSAQAYVSDHPTETVDNLQKLTTGGFRRSQNVVWVKGDFTNKDGNIEIKSTAQGLVDSNALIFHNGRIEFPNSPN